MNILKVKESKQDTPLYESIITHKGDANSYFSKSQTNEPRYTPARTEGLVICDSVQGWVEMMDEWQAN